MNPDVREVLEQAEGKSLVERLAKRCANEQYAIIGSYAVYPVAYRANARWWLNAIAEELLVKASEYSNSGSTPYPEAARWLREQASK